MAAPDPTPAELCRDGALTVPQAAAFIGVGRSRIYELIAAGELRSLRLGRRRLIPRAEAARLLAERLEQGDEGAR